MVALTLATCSLRCFWKRSRVWLKSRPKSSFTVKNNECNVYARHSQKYRWQGPLVVNLCNSDGKFESLYWLSCSSSFIKLNESLSHFVDWSGFKCYTFNSQNARTHPPTQSWSKYIMIRNHYNASITYSGRKQLLHILQLLLSKYILFLFIFLPNSFTVKHFYCLM